MKDLAPYKFPSNQEKVFQGQLKTLMEKFLTTGEVPKKEHFLKRLLEEYHLSSLPAPYDQIFLSWWQNVHELQFLEKAFTNDLIREIILHGPYLVQYDKKGRLEEAPPSPLDPEHFQLCLEILAQKGQVQWNYSHPFCSFHFSHCHQNIRATLIHFSLTPYQRSKLFLRKLPATPYTLAEFHPEKFMHQFIHSAIRDRKNILLCGATNSGKTSLLNTLLSMIPPNEHIVILEDTHELTSTQSHATTHLLSQNQLKEKSFVDLCAYALRLRPDRILLGEIRQAEIIPFFLSMNTGHQGLISTLHASSAYEALSRCALLMSLFSENKELNYPLMMELVCRNLDYVFFMENKRIKEVLQVLGAENGKAFVEIIFPQASPGSIYSDTI